MSKKEYPVRYRDPSPQNLEAIVSYLTNPNIDALVAGELDQQRFSWQVPRRLSEFLSEEIDQAEQAPLMQLEGTYRASLSTDETVTVTRLTLRHDAENGFIRADEASDIYTNPGTGDVLSLTTRQRHKHHRVRTDAAGWAVLTPEDNILFVLKDRAFGFNHYWTLAAEALPWQGAPVARLILQKHDEPTKLDELAAGDNGAQQDIPHALYQHLLGMVFCFERI